MNKTGMPRMLDRNPVQPITLKEVDFGTPLRRPRYPRSKVAASLLAPANAEDTVTLSIDGQQVTVPRGTSVIRAAAEVGIQIPKLCATDSLEPFGSCPLCLVEVEGKAGFPVHRARCPRSKGRPSVPSHRGCSSCARRA